MYTDGDIFGIGWKYDNIHQDQIDWYKTEINKLNALNKAKYASLSAVDKAAYALATGQDAVQVEAKFLNPDSMTIKSSTKNHNPHVEYK